MAGQSGQLPPASHTHAPTGEQPTASTVPSGRQLPASAAPTGQQPPASALSGPGTLGGMVSSCLADQLTLEQEGIGGQDATRSSASLLVLNQAAFEGNSSSLELEQDPSMLTHALVSEPEPQHELEQEIDSAEEVEPEPQQMQEQEQEPTSGDGSTKVRMFAELLELPKKIPHWMWPGRTGKAMHPEMLKPVHCGHCGQLEDLSRPPTPIEDATEVDGSPPPDHLVTVSVLVDQIAFEGNSCLTCVKMIYEKTRPSLEQEGSGCDTPLHYAARSRNCKMLFHFICLIGDEYGFERVAQVLRKLNGRRETALHATIWQGNKYMAELLMRVDPELALYPPPGEGTSPLYLALSLGYTRIDIARMLHTRSGGNLSYSGPDGQNALHAAAHHSYDMIPTLLHWKKDLSKEVDENGSTPLHLVVSSQSPTVLIRALGFRVTNNSTPMEIFATWRVFRANASAACQQDKNGLFPVHIAALMDRPSAICALLAGYPGCIGFHDNQGRSFLHIAVQNKSFHVVRYACKMSIFASIMNTQDNDGNTALHLSVDVGDLSIFCALLGNPEVLLNIRNNKDQTPFDLAWSKKGQDFSYGWNPEWVIHKTLLRAGARYNCFWRDCIQQRQNLVPEPEPVQSKEDKEKEESAKVTDATRTLGIGSVLIASVTFAAAFTVPAGVKASDHTKDDTPGLLGMWHFNAFMMANALAFICSSLAIVGLMFAGTPVVKLPIRRMHLQRSVFFASSSLTCLNVAFALGAYMVLAPVGRKTAIAICSTTPLVLIYTNADHLNTMYMILRPLYVRRGFKYVCTSFMARIFLLLIFDFWPLALIFMWKAPGLA